MESVKSRELKDDAILNVKVNKTFYLMCKSALFTSFKEIQGDSKNAEEFIKNLVSKKYEEMTDKERTFYTITLLVGEIEKQAVETNSFIEKEHSLEDLKKDLEANISKSNED
tara:strand:- start:120 stop:455 length:336 start_codon:yes stop_codon:yes gene_type:complete